MSLRTNFRKTFIGIGILFLVTQISFAQEIALGTWRAHVSFGEIHGIAISPNKVYAASSGGIQVFDKQDFSVNTYTKVNGLSAAGITSVAFDDATNQLLIAYEDGNLDISGSSGFVNYSALKNLPTVTGSKRINDISLNGGYAYLSTDYGVVVFDLAILEVKETFRDLGPNGEKMQVFESTFYNDSIFLATENGVLGGDLSDNLLDFNNWVRQDAGDFNNPVRSVEVFNDKLYAAIDGFGIYSYDGIWTKESYLNGKQFRKLNAGGNLYIATADKELWKLDAASLMQQLTDPLIGNPQLGIDDGATIWIGDAKNGLIQGAGTAFARVSVNSPNFNVASRLRYIPDVDRLYAVSGGPDANFLPREESYPLNSFKSGTWNSEGGYLEKDLTDVIVSGKTTYLSSFGDGLQVIEISGATTFNESNSPLQSVGGPGNVFITAIEMGSNGIWVANYGATTSLLLLKFDGTWEPVPAPNLASRYITTITLDYLGNAWMTLDPSKGGGVWVYNKSTGLSAYLTDAANQGGLPSRYVYSIASDRNGQMWVGTQQGVAYFPDPSRVYSAVNANRPVFGTNYLLRDELVTAIAVDGGNRKWFGSQRGVWLLNNTGDELIHNFNNSNSPLLSDAILDIEIQANTGEVFLSTSNGLVSFRSDATSSTTTFKNVKIFPNPVTASFIGQVGISGLSTDAIVKITDVSGKLVWQGTANGGTASWDVRDYNGRRPSTGVYLVLSTSTDGVESVVGKIAIVN